MVGIYDRGKLGVAAADIDAASDGWLKALIKDGDVSSKPGRASVFAAPDGVKAKRIAVIGLGRAADFDAVQYRKAIGAAMAALLESKVRDIAIGLALEKVGGTPPYYLGRHTSEAIAASLYTFETLKTGAKQPRPRVRKITVAVNERGDANPLRLGAEHGVAIAEGAALTRDLGNLPANVCTPSYLAKTAKDLAKKHRNVQTRVLSEAEIKRLGMRTFLSVSSGTEEPPKLIVMQYRGAGKGAPIVLIGKGITFDAGGISLKPGPGMDEMKFDMCGAAAVMAALATAAALELPINVTAVVPSCENLPSGAATKPGDIIKSMSGQTVEILNTDAEGRLLLCDALTYARRFKPAAVIDVATLTGACVIALGHHRTAVMSEDDELACALIDAGIAAEDRGWRMPIAAEYAESLKSNFADFANVGGREGGAITAACFLGKFTKGMTWAHLDIAGTAWHAGPKKGASGRPVPMLVEFLLRRAGVLP